LSKRVLVGPLQVGRVLVDRLGVAPVAFGSAVAFLVFVYVSAIVLIVGAEMVALWPRVRAGDYDPKEARTVPPGGGVVGFVIGLVKRGDEGPGTGKETDAPVPLS